MLDVPASPGLVVETVDVASLVPYARNARTHSAMQVDEIAASMREFGWTNPVLIDGEGGIIAGHGRVMAAVQLGMEQVPCIRLAHLSEKQKRAYVLADNKLALNSGWDEDMLRSELQALAGEDYDLGLIGFSNEELSDLFANVDASPWKTDPDEAPAVRPRAESKPGDVWICGEHRVTCGDSLVLADLQRVMDGGLADASWTDPPYNVDYRGKAGKIANDSMADGAFRTFLLDAFTAARDVMRPGAPMYVAHADTEGLNFRGAFEAAGFKLSGCLIWAKDSLVLGRSDYQWQHEPILYGWKPGARHPWFGGRKKTTLQQVVHSAFAHNADGSVTVTVGMEALTISGADLVVTEAESSLIRCESRSARPSTPR